MTFCRNIKFYPSTCLVKVLVILQNFSCFVTRYSKKEPWTQQTGKSLLFSLRIPGGGEGGGVLGYMFAGYVPLDSHSPYPIIVYFLGNHTPHLSHFLENVIFAILT